MRSTACKSAYAGSIPTLASNNQKSQILSTLAGGLGSAPCQPKRFGNFPTSCAIGMLRLDDISFLTARKIPGTISRKRSTEPLFL